MKSDSRLGLMVLVAILAAPTAWAQGSEWTDVGPEGTGYSLPVFDPQDPATVYMPTGTGVFKSTDGGVSWSNTGLIGWSVGSLLMDPQNSSILYAQVVFSPDEDTSISKLFKSADGGATWNDLVSGARLLAIDPQDSGTLYSLAGGYPQGLYKSTDGGAIWVRLSGLPADLNIFGLVIDPQNHNTLYTTIQGYSGGRPVATVFKSRDGGASWNESASGLPATFQLDGVANALNFAGLTIDQNNPSTLYATKMLAGVFKSTDGGASWRAANFGMPNNPTGFPTCCSTGVVIDPQSPNTLYAPGGNPTNLVIYKSTNGGTSWSAMSSLGAAGFGALEIGPHSTVYATSGAGPLKSTDGGATWSPLNIRSRIPVAFLAIDPQSSGTLYAGGLKSTDAGMNWSPATSGLQGEIVALAIDPQAPGTAYAATDVYECGNGNMVGIFKSVNGGASWTDTKSGIGCGLTAVVVDPQNPGTVYAGSSYRGVYKSPDGGASWTTMNSGLPIVGLGPNVIALAVDPKNSGTLYAGLYGGGLFKSTDGGASWSDAGLAPRSSRLAIDPQNTTTVYAVTSSGLFKSADGGASWGRLSPTSSNTVYAVAIDPQSSGVIYAGTDIGVVQSTDGGDHWNPIPGGPLNVTVLALDPQAPTTLYAGGAGGLFAITLQPQSSSAAPVRKAEWSPAAGPASHWRAGPPRGVECISAWHIGPCVSSSRLRSTNS